MSDGDTGLTCIEPFEVVVNDIPGRRGRWFESHSKHDLEAKLLTTVTGKISGESISETFREGLEALYFERGADRHLIGAVIEIDTVERVVDFTPEGSRCDPDDTACSPSLHRCTEDEASRIDTADEFLSHCGDRYLERERMGGYVFISADVSDLSAEFGTDYLEAFDVGASVDRRAGANFIDGEIATLLGLGSEIDRVTFYVQALGLPLPDGTFGNARVPIDLNEWSSYMSAIEQGVKQAIEEAHTSRHAAYGTVIHQEFQYYDLATLDECITGEDVMRGQFDCHTAFWTGVGESVGTSRKRSFTQLDRAVTTVRWKLENPGRVRWGSAENDRAAFADALSDYDACQRELIPDAARQCVEARSTDLGAWCDLCVIPDGCSVSALTARFDALPHAPILPPESYDAPEPDASDESAWQPYSTFRVGNDSEGDAEPVDSHYCALTGLGGSFQGTGEGVRLVQAGNGYWRGVTWSESDSSEQYLSMDVTCSPRRNFFDKAEYGWSEEAQATYLALPTRSIDHTLSGSAASVFALAGISGHMEGGGECFDITQGQGADMSSITGRSQQSDLRAWVNAFGLAQPSDELPNYSRVESVSTASNVQRAEKKLESVKKSLCYLTNVSGNFDGRAERVWIEERDQSWWLVAQAGCEKSYRLKSGCKTWKHVSAVARCYRFNQR